MTPDPPDDDKCQISMCNQTHFTYCPHCKLFVCIEHLNEHYSNYRQEYQLLLKESQQELVSNKEFLAQVDQEKQQLIRFFSRQGQYYQLQEKYFSDKAAQITIRPQDCADLRYYLSQSSEKRSKLKKLFADIQQLIHDYDCQQPPQLSEDSVFPIVKVKNEDIDQKPRTSKSSPLAQFSIDYEEIDDDEGGDTAPATTTTTKVNGFKKSEKSSGNKQHIEPVKTNGTNGRAKKNSKKDISDELTHSEEDSEDEEENETDNDNSGSDPDFRGPSRTVRVKSVEPRRKDIATSRPAVNHFQVSVCPLANKRYGIDLNRHPLRHVPCDRQDIASISLFTHLRVFHCLNSKASLRLVRHIMYNGCERDQDLFSYAIDSLVNILPKSYRGRCPLTRLGAFGLNKFHDIRLCDASHTHENTGLLNHFVVYHYLSYPWANKLCNAMQAGDSDGSKQILFKPNEPIKAEKWLTNQGKLLLAKRLSSNRKSRRRTTNTKVKK